MNAIGINLKRYRRLNNMSLKEVGKKLNMNASTISKYEKGKIGITSQKLIAFANLYNIKCIDILRSYSLPEINFSSFEKRT